MRDELDFKTVFSSVKPFFPILFPENWPKLFNSITVGLLIDIYLLLLRLRVVNELFEQRALAITSMSESPKLFAYHVVVSH